MVDTSRIGAAIERPHLDPATWNTLAIVNTVVVTDEGQICDITTVHGIEETAVAAPPYGGRGYGMHLPIEEGSMVLVEFPEGEFATGGRIIAHIQDKGSPPPQLAQDHPEDVAFVVRPQQNMRVVVSEGGVLELGAVGPIDEAILGTTYRAAEDPLFSALSAALLSIAENVAALAAAMPTLSGSPVQQAAYATSVTAVADTLSDFQTKLADFQAQADSFLSQSVKIGV